MAGRKGHKNLDGVEGVDTLLQSFARFSLYLLSCAVRVSALSQQGIRCIGSGVGASDRTGQELLVHRFLLAKDTSYIASFCTQYLKLALSTMSRDHQARVVHCNTLPVLGTHRSRYLHLHPQYFTSTNLRLADMNDQPTLVNSIHKLMLLRPLLSPPSKD